MTLVEKLRHIGTLKTGDAWPEFLSGSGYYWDWGAPLAQLCIDAADEIDRLRVLAGVVSDGPSLAELRAQLPKRDPHPER